MPITINGTTGIAGVDGTAGAPALQGTDTNTGMFFPAADTIAFGEGGVESMRLDSSGNVGIGTSSPVSGSRLDVRGSNSNTLTDLNNQVSMVYDTSAVAQNVGGGISFGYQFDTGQFIQRGAVIKAAKENATAGNYATALIFATTANSASTAERARIDSSGNLLVGTTSGSFKANINGSVTATYFSGNINGITNVTTGGGAVAVSSGDGLIFFSGAIAGNDFKDLVIAQSFGSINVISSATFGTPPTRTYTLNGSGGVSLSLSGGTAGTYPVRFTRISNT